MHSFFRGSGRGLAINGQEVLQIETRWPIQFIEETVKDKINIRYISFRTVDEGGRLFDFSISATEHPAFLTSFEMPAELFAGANRIRLQEGVGICYAKLKYLLETGVLSDVPERVCLTASDVAQYREVLPRTSSGRAKPGFNWICDERAS